MKAPRIPLGFTALWRQVRYERAILRQHIGDRVFEFHRRFPRRRRRVLPQLSYSDEANWFEPSPVDLEDGRRDRLGLAVRWRVSGLIPIEIGGQRRLRAIWDHNWTARSMPPDSLLRAGDITDPGAIDDYRYLWRTIHTLYGTYKWIGQWFPSIVSTYWERDEHIAALNNLGLTVIASELQSSARLEKKTQGSVG